MVIGFDGELQFISFQFSSLIISQLLFVIISGEFDDDINFTFDLGTEVFGSCVESLNDEMWVLGG